MRHRLAKRLPPSNNPAAGAGVDPPLPAAAWQGRARPVARPDDATRMKDIDEVLARLSKSAFRRRFELRKSDRAYLVRKGLPAVLAHARGFIGTRLAAANPVNDGRQTPFRGHPVFVAQHATATCCRGCLEKWHAIPRGRPLQASEQDYILAVLERWLQSAAGEMPPPDEPRLI